MSPPPGSVVAYWESGALALAVVVGEEKQRLRIITSAGHDERIQPSRVIVLVESGRATPATTPEGRKREARRIDEVAGRVASLVSLVDVPLLWELAVEAGGPLDDHALAELALSDGGGEARTALIRALVEDGVRFVRKGSNFEPRSREAVQEIVHQRERERVRESERVAFFGELEAMARGELEALSESETARRHLDALADLAIRDLEAAPQSRDLSLAALKAARLPYDRPAEGAFRLARRCGRFGSDDENLAIRRYELRTAFPEEVLAAAATAKERGYDRTGREDLSAWEVITIDGPRTREIDDALSVERRGTRFRLGIHIADPGAFISPGDPVDREALARTVTHYLPEVRLAMLPPDLSEDAASLLPGAERPALSFLIDLDDAGNVLDYEVKPSVVRSAGRFDYDAVDRILLDRSGALAARLGDLSAAASALESARLRSGAIRIEADEVDVHVESDGRIVLERSRGRSPSHQLVSEAMVLASGLAARFCMEHELPAIYRRQPPPDGPPPPLPEGAPPELVARTLRRSLRRGEVSLTPGAHFALGLAAYAQATSPLRRYQDLAVHRQIVSFLSRGVPLYDAEAIRVIAATTERAEVEGRRAERASERYWLLRYLEEGEREPLDAVVVEVEPRPVVVLLGTLLEEAVPSLASAALGDRVRLAVERVNPRADLLVLRPV